MEEFETTYEGSFHPSVQQQQPRIICLWPGVESKRLWGSSMGTPGHLDIRRNGYEGFGLPAEARTPMPTKLVQLNFELIFSYFVKVTNFNILLYIYLYLQIINVNKPRKIPRDQCKTYALLREAQISQ